MNTRSLRAVLRSPLGALSLTIIAIVAIIAIVGPGPWQQAATTIDPSIDREGPSAAHWLGTDELGRDVLARVMSATQVTVLLALLATLLGAAIGLPFGALTSILPRRARRFGTRVIAIWLAFPGILVAIIIAAILGPGMHTVTLAIGIAMVPGFARLAQTLSASVAASNYVAAARMLGVGRARLLGRHVLPNIAEPFVVTTSSVVAESLLAITAISFLGLGVQPPAYDWGTLLNAGLVNIYTTPVAALGPAAAVVITGLGLTTFGEVLAGTARVTAGVSRRDARKAGAPAPGVEPGAGDAGGALLSMRDLRVRIHGASGPTEAVRGVDLDIEPGEKVGIVGESGSGKTLTALSIAQLLDFPLEPTTGRMRFQGQAVTAQNADRILGRGTGMIFQDPGMSLNPLLRIGRQLTEKSRLVLGRSRREAHRAALTALDEVRITEPALRMRQHPHELSGGMRQRVMIAGAMAGEPQLLIADEPTTALDATVQRGIMALLDTLNREHSTAILLISHDLALVSATCDRIAVMYAGAVVEEGPTADLLERRAHPYTRLLLGSIPTMHTDREQPLPTIPAAPSGHVPTAGCRFADRCPIATQRCRDEEPVLVDNGRTRAACWNQDRSAEVAP